MPAYDNNLTLVLHAAKDMRLEDRPIPEPGTDEVQIAMQAVGICGSDVHLWQEGEVGDFTMTDPVILGHEPSGIVTKLGEGVEHLKIGDRVAIDIGVPCRKCNTCKDGRYHQCLDNTFSATAPFPGTLSRYYIHPADFCHKLPDNVSLEDGALIEPLCVALHACRRGNIAIGQRILVCGAGPIGLVTLLTAKAMGASKVVITDLDDVRLQKAREMGADYTTNATGKDPRALATEITKLLGRAPDVTFECSAAESSVQMAIYATKTNGTVVLVGMGSADMTVPLKDALLREVDIRGVFRSVNCHPTAVEMVANGQVNLRPLVTHRFPLEQSVEAFEMARSGRATKVIIDCAKHA